MYNADEIQVLHGLEPVRKRPAMYIGDLSDPATLTCLVVQGLCHGIDELVSGAATQLTITLANGGVVSIADDGAGMSVDRSAARNDGAPYAEVIMTTLHACRLTRVNVGVAERYCTVGLAVLNALSEWAELEIERAGQAYGQKYLAGNPSTPFESLGATQGHGTTLRFRPDPMFFTHAVDAAALETRLAAIRSDVPGRIAVVDQRR